MTLPVEIWSYLFDFLDTNSQLRFSSFNYEYKDFITSYWYHNFHMIHKKNVGLPGSFTVFNTAINLLDNPNPILKPSLQDNLKAVNIVKLAYMNVYNYTQRKGMRKQCKLELVVWRLLTSPKYMKTYPFWKARLSGYLDMINIPYTTREEQQDICPRIYDKDYELKMCKYHVNMAKHFLTCKLDRSDPHQLIVYDIFLKYPSVVSPELIMSESIDYQEMCHRLIHHMLMDKKDEYIILKLDYRFVILSRIEVYLEYCISYNLKLTLVRLLSWDTNFKSRPHTLRLRILDFILEKNDEYASTSISTFNDIICGDIEHYLALLIKRYLFETARYILRIPDLHLEEGSQIRILNLLFEYTNDIIGNFIPYLRDAINSDIKYYLNKCVQLRLKYTLFNIISKHDISFLQTADINMILGFIFSTRDDLYINSFVEKLKIHIQNDEFNVDEAVDLCITWKLTRTLTTLVQILSMNQLIHTNRDAMLKFMFETAKDEHVALFIKDKFKDIILDNIDEYLDLALDNNMYCVLAQYIEWDSLLFRQLVSIDGLTIKSYNYGNNKFIVDILHPTYSNIMSTKSLSIVDNIKNNKRPEGCIIS